MARDDNGSTTSPKERATSATVAEKHFTLDDLDKGNGVGVRIPRSTAKKLIREGQLASRVIAGRRFVTESQLADYLARCTVPARVRNRQLEDGDTHATEK